MVRFLDTVFTQYFFLQKFCILTSVFRNKKCPCPYACLIKTPTPCALSWLWPPYEIGQAIIFLPCGFCLLSFFFFFFPPLISAAAHWISTILQHMVWPQREFRMHVWNMLHVARWKYRTQKLRKKIAIWAPSRNVVGLYVRNEGTHRQSEKNLLNSNISPICPHDMVNFGLLAVEIGSGVLGTLRKLQRVSCVLAALLHGTLVVGVSQTLRRWTEGATYIRQGGHHVGHWTTF